MQVAQDQGNVVTVSLCPAPALSHSYSHAHAQTVQLLMSRRFDSVMKSTRDVVIVSSMACHATLRTQTSSKISSPP